MSYHKKLEDQVNELLPAEYREDEFMKRFLHSIDHIFYQFEEEKKSGEAASRITDREYQQIKDQITKAKHLETALIEAKEQAENAAKAKSDFLSVMSHEIRTPLNAIIGNVHLLQQEDPLPAQQEYLRVLHISAENLLSLINDILDFGKIEEGKIAFAAKDIDIYQLVSNLIAANRMRAEERGNKLKIRFDKNIPAFIRGDEVRLNQVLNNLLSNAVKFTLEGEIIVEVTLQKITEFEVDIAFAVIDSGIGIEDEKQELIFERFTQADSDITRQFGGSGLGLTIIRRLLQLQDSDIHVESTWGEGSRFSFVLTFGKSERLVRDETQFRARVHDLQGAHILLVEDVEFNVRVAEKMLLNWKANVDVAENGLIAVEKAKANDYKLILMDLQMPVMDGYRASLAIRKMSKEVPIVALTASVSSDITEKVYECGMDDYISKPFNPDDLYKTIFKYVM